MLGAIAGDIIGSAYEGKVGWQSARTPHFRPLFHPKARFTDDTVLTVPVIPVRHLNDGSPEDRATYGSIVEEGPEDGRPHRRSIPRRADPAGRDAQCDPQARPQRGPADPPGQTAEPTEERPAKRAETAIHVVGMAGEALGQECGLLRVVGDESRRAEQPEPIDPPEPPPDRPGRHPLSGQAQCIAQGRPQQGAGQAIGDRRRARRDSCIRGHPSALRSPMGVLPSA
jgi:hypothetical protein